MMESLYLLSRGLDRVWRTSDGDCPPQEEELPVDQGNTERKYRVASVSKINCLLSC